MAASPPAPAAGAAWSRCCRDRRGALRLFYAVTGRSNLTRLRSWHLASNHSDQVPDANGQGLRANRQRLTAKRFSAPVNGNVVLRVRRADVIGARPDQAVVAKLLHHVRRPAADTRDGKDRGEQVKIDA